MTAEIRSRAAAEGGKRIARAAIILLAGWIALSSVQAQTVAIASAPSMAKEKSLWQRLFGRMEWCEVERAYETPREVCRVVDGNLRYASDDADVWSSASNTWSRGKGDCEDLAICVQALCRVSGISSKVHLYFPAAGGPGHAVLVGEWEGKTWFSSNGSYEEVKSEQDVLRRVARVLSCKESQLWVMKLTEDDVARYMHKSPALAVAAE